MKFDIELTHGNIITLVIIFLAMVYFIIYKFGVLVLLISIVSILSVLALVVFLMGGYFNMDVE